MNLCCVLMLLFSSHLLSWPEAAAGADAVRRFDLNAFFQQAGQQTALRDPKFAFQNCKENAAFTINSVTLSPDPVRIPGRIQFSGDATVSHDISGQIAVDLKLTRYFKSYKFDIPCVDGFGSCVYTDFCAIFPSMQCPAFFKKPFVPKGNYNYQNFEADIDLPVKIPSGLYSAKANFFADIGHVGCVEVYVNIA